MVFVLFGKNKKPNRFEYKTPVISVRREKTWDYSFRVIIIYFVLAILVYK